MTFSVIPVLSGLVASQTLNTRELTGVDDEAACPSGYPSLPTGSSPTGYIAESKDIEAGGDCKCESMQSMLKEDTQWTCRAVVYGVYKESAEGGNAGKKVCRYYYGDVEEDRGDKYNDLDIKFLCRNPNAPEPTEADCGLFDGKETECLANEKECKWDVDEGYCNQHKCHFSYQCPDGGECKKKENSSQGWCTTVAEENSDEEPTENLKGPGTAPEGAAVDGQ